MNGITTIWLFLITLFLSGSFNNFVIISEQGVGQAKLNVSTYKEVKKMFRGGKTTKHVRGGKKVTYSARMANGDSKPMTLKLKKKIARTYTIKKQGISFYFNNNNTLSSISVWGKNKFQTDKGIIVGESTFHDFDNAYGKTQFERIGSRWVKSHKNLIFYADASLKASEHSRPAETMNRLTIKEIKILIN